MQTPQQKAEAIGRPFRAYFKGEGKKISMSEANSAAEQAKNRALAIEQVIDEAAPYKRTMTIDGVAVVLNDPEVPTEIGERLAMAAEFWGLVAYLKEAVKAKASWLDAIENAPINEFADGPLPEEPVRPTRPPAPTFTEPTEADLDEDSARLAEYYTLEAQTAKLGQRLAPNGTLHKLAHAKTLKFTTLQPVRIGGTDHNPERREVPVEHDPVLEPGVAASLYDELMKEHRSLERQLNRLKAQRKNRLSEIKRERLAAYEDALARQRADYDRALGAYEKIRAERSDLVSERSARALRAQSAELKRVSALKVVVPPALVDTFNELSQ